MGDFIPKRGSPLTDREKEILHWIVLGKSNEEIALALGDISAHTVKNHVQKILRRMGLFNRVQIAVHALLTGEVPLQPLLKEMHLEQLATVRSTAPFLFRATHRNTAGREVQVLNRDLKMQPDGANCAMWMPAVHYRDELGREFVLTYDMFESHFSPIE